MKQQLDDEINNPVPRPMNEEEKQYEKMMLDKWEKQKAEKERLQGLAEKAKAAKAESEKQRKSVQDHNKESVPVPKS